MYIAKNSDMIEYLIAKTPENQVLLAQWVPIINMLVQSASDHTDILKCFIRYIPREWKDPLEDDDKKADQMRTYSVLAYYCNKANLFDFEKVPESQKLLTHLINQIHDYSSEKHSVFVKYECLNLAGILYNLKSPVKPKNDGGDPKPKIVGDILCNSLLRIMNQYFPLWSTEIKPDTREKRYYEMIFDGILNLITFSKNPQALKLMYRVIKEDKTLLEHKLEIALHTLITKGINTLGQAEFLMHSRAIFAEFIDFDSDEQASVSARRYFAGQPQHPQQPQVRHRRALPAQDIPDLPVRVPDTADQRVCSKADQAHSDRL